MHKYYYIWKSLLALLVLFFFVNEGVTQITRPTPVEQDEFSQDGLSQNRVKDFKGFDSLQLGKDPSVPDSTIFRSFTLLDITDYIDYVDTTLDNALKFADPARDPHEPRANLGNVSSASHPLLYTPYRATRFHSGYHEYEPYNVTIDQFRYFKTNRAISDLYFSSIANQENLSIKTDFTRNFSDGIQLSVNYRRNSNIGFYSTQRARTTNFGSGLWYQSPSDKFNFFLTYVSNVNTEEQNGGITTDTFYGTQFAEFREAIPTFLSDANTRHQQRSIRASNYYKITAPDSSDWNLQLQYDLEYSWNYWNYDDVLNNTENDSILYQGYKVDNRGMRTFITDNSLSQAIYIHGIGPRGYQGKVGLQYDRHQVSQANQDSTINDLSLVFDASIPFVKSLQLYSTGSLGLGSNAGSFDIDGFVNINVKDWARLKGGSSFFRRSIELIEDQFWVNDQKIFDNDFSKPFGSTVYGTLSIPKLNSSISLRQTLENNPIVWGDDAQPYQFNGLFSSTQLNAKMHLTFGGWNLENYIQYQILSEEIIDLPEFVSTHLLYWDGNIFSNNMNLRVGVQSRFVPEYTAQRFMPVNGKFHTGSSSLEYYNDLDFFISFRVQSMRMFFQMQNIADFWNGDRGINYQVQNYPQFDAKLRYGVRWLLFD